MPWCDDCDRFWTLEAVVPSDGACPNCGALLPEVGAKGKRGEERTPWHFKVILVAIVAYLAWRAVQGVVWVVGHL